MELATKASQAEAGTRVVLRIRPLSEREAGSARCLERAGESTVKYSGRDTAGKPSTLSFAAVYDEQATSAALFERSLRDVVVAAVAGESNGTVLAYGQTGSGKTHTLLGSGHEKGMVQLAVSELAQAVAQEPAGCEVKVSLSVLEVYNERIRDLLCPAHGQDNLAVVADPVRGVHAAGATQLPVRGEGECMRVAQAGLSQRAVASTAMNAASSRSHCIVTLSVDRLYPDGGLRCSKLCLVDLAGSERSSRTRAEGALLAEGSQINKSLSALGNVVNALSEGGAKTHIPYRDSKLTRLLQDSLGGGAQTVLILCCSPAMPDDAETISTLRFGERAQAIRSVPAAIEVRHSTEQLSRLLQAAQDQNLELQREVERLGSQPAGQQAGGAGAQAPPAPPSRFKLGFGLQVLGLLAYLALENWREATEPICERGN